MGGTAYGEGAKSILILKDAMLKPTFRTKARSSQIFPLISIL
jgi:hypothetical protein